MCARPGDSLPPPVGPPQIERPRVRAVNRKNVRCTARSSRPPSPRRPLAHTRTCTRERHRAHMRTHVQRAQKHKRASAPRAELPDQVLPPFAISSHQCPAVTSKPAAFRWSNATVTGTAAAEPAPETTRTAARRPASYGVPPSLAHMHTHASDRTRMCTHARPHTRAPGPHIAHSERHFSSRKGQACGRSAVGRRRRHKDCRTCA